MNPYNTPAPAPSRPWWRTTPALLGLLALVALLSAFSLPLGFLTMIAAMVAVWVLSPWRWFTRIGATLSTLLLLTVGAGLGGQVDDSRTAPADAKTADNVPASGTAVSASPTASKAAKAGDYTGRPLNEAEKDMRSAGYTAINHDAADEDRVIILRSGWTVCFQSSNTAAKTIDFAAVRTSEPCPEKDGGPLPWPKMPNVVGATYNKAIEDLKQAGVDLDQVTLDDVYLDIDTPTAVEAAKDGDDWRVCFQSPGTGNKVDFVTTVNLGLGLWTDADLVRHCPSEKDTTYKIPANDPDYNGGSSSTDRDHSAPHRDSSSSSGSSTSGGTSVGTVHPGSFCSPAGAAGVSSAGTPMVCGPGSDGRDRWHRA
ncbi:Stk1 family PASTA domain-containing Ser/Thr kinase [Streptomyces sp. NBC_00687]|uniref:Stk1 family PASTA domain-containing Ser/Thr kinase n=1 Tax=Streptomyces sp. NBC_00687 TaxID=2975807 RepID=UPI002251D7F2|nr:Stk1 family PASTA domain-containing Ser/Thr kinase [Streptomyces sp. NBC_00687]MCX4912056.1 PASTA domain-containing protein [Streptomyces sp. NBC_00687]